MESRYTAFLQSPSASQLASDASINYITTTTSISEPAAIIKHLNAQAKLVTKKQEKMLNSIQSSDSLFLETETTLQFNNGGGAFLPSMDENLLDEKMVTFPLLHVVHFDDEGKIKQIRMHWDQGALLKQVEAIGKTGRNWPIRDGSAQIEAIKKSAKATTGSSNLPVREHSKHESVSATRDPHASLNLFAPRDPNESAPGEYQGPRHAPRASAKPPSRDLNALIANDSESPANLGSSIRSPSPTKGGAGKHHTDNRLFSEENDENAGARSPERKKVYEHKYNHFDFGDGEDVPQSSRPTSNGKTKGAATFSFEDFSTPPKVSRKARPDDQVHWGAEDPPTPPERPIVHAARPDAESHFNLADDQTPVAQRPTSHQRQKGMALYHDPVFGADEESPQKPSATNQTNTNNTRRGADFAPHYSMTDSPQARNDENAPPSRSKHVTRESMEQHWAFSDPKPDEKIYNTAGDGMGSRKKPGQGNSLADWMTGEEEKTGQIYKTAGDGMGGRTGGRTWGIGDEVGGEEPRYTGRGRGPRS